MSRLILIQEDDYDRQYLESKEYMYAKYHDHPSQLKNIPYSESDVLDLSITHSHGRLNQQNAQPHRNTPLGKLVI